MKYQELRDALPQLIAEAERQGGTNNRAQMIIDLLEERDNLIELTTDYLKASDDLDNREYAQHPDDWGDLNGRKRACREDLDVALSQGEQT